MPNVVAQVLWHGQVIAQHLYYQQHQTEPLVLEAIVKTLTDKYSEEFVNVGGERLKNGKPDTFYKETRFQDDALVIRARYGVPPTDTPVHAPTLASLSDLFIPRSYRL